MVPSRASTASAGAAAAVVSFLLLALISLAAWMLEPSGQQDWAQTVEVAARRPRDTVVLPSFCRVAAMKTRGVALFMED